MKVYNILKFPISILLPLCLLAQGERWIYRYNGPGAGNNCANSLVYGADGNIYAAGTTSNGIDNDFTVISLKKNTGDTNWVFLYDGPGDGPDNAYSIVYGNGNIYTAGYSYGNGTSEDFTVISLTPAGDINWVYRYNGPGNNADCANSIVYGADSNIYAAGYSYGHGTFKDFMVISLTPAGDINWVYRYNGLGNGDDCANSIVYGTDGNIYAAGYSYGNGTFEDFTMISLTTSGNENWLYRYSGEVSPANGHDEAYSIVYGTDGNLYAAGRSSGNGTSGDFAVIGLTTAGDTRWVHQNNGPAHGDDCANSVVYGPDNNIYASGTFNVYDSLRSVAVISLTPAGSTNWIYWYCESSNDTARSVTCGMYLYVAGRISNDFTIICLSPYGDPYWFYRYNGSGTNADCANSIISGADWNIYAAGTTSNGIDNDFTVVSLPS